MAIQKRRTMKLLPNQQVNTISDGVLPPLPQTDPESDQACRSNYQFNANRGERVMCKRHHKM